MMGAGGLGLVLPRWSSAATSKPLPVEAVFWPSSGFQSRSSTPVANRRRTPAGAQQLCAHDAGSAQFDPLDGCWLLRHQNQVHPA